MSKNELNFLFYNEDYYPMAVPYGAILALSDFHVLSNIWNKFKHRSIPNATADIKYRLGVPLMDDYHLFSLEIAGNPKKDHYFYCTVTKINEDLIYLQLLVLNNKSNQDLYQDIARNRPIIKVTNQNIHLLQYKKFRKVVRSGISFSQNLLRPEEEKFQKYSNRIIKKYFSKLKIEFHSGPIIYFYNSINYPTKFWENHYLFSKEHFEFSTPDDDFKIYLRKSNFSIDAILTNARFDILNPFNFNKFTIPLFYIRLLHISQEARKIINIQSIENRERFKFVRFFFNSLELSSKISEMNVIIRLNLLSKTMTLKNNLIESIPLSYNFYSYISKRFSENFNFISEAKSIVDNKIDKKTNILFFLFNLFLSIAAIAVAIVSIMTKSE